MQYSHSSWSASPGPRSISGTASTIGLALFLSLLTMFLLCSATNAAATTPTTAPALTINPAYAPPGSNILLWGSGFDPYSSIDIYFDATHLATITTNGAGTFGRGSIHGGFAVQVPVSAIPGNHWIAATERSGQKMARKQFLVRTDWAQFHFDAGHSGLNPYENVLSPTTVAGLQLDWSYQIGGAVTSSPAVVNGVLYVPSQDGNLYALKATTGALLWKYTTGGAVYSSPAVAAGVVYFGSWDNNLYAVNATTGALLWQFPIVTTPFYWSPTVANGVVYFGPVALNASTGAVLWQFTNDGTVAVGDNHVFFGGVDPTTGNAMIYARDASTGALVWSTVVAYSNPYGGFGFSTPAVSAPYLYVNVMAWVGDTEYGNLFCLGMGGGIGWEGPVGGVGSDPAVGYGMVYNPTEAVHNRPASLSAFMDGVLVWQYQAAGVGSPAVANGVVYFSAGGNLYALKANTGAVLWQYPLGVTSPVVANGFVYVGSGGNVYAFGLPTGGSR